MTTLASKPRVVEVSAVAPVRPPKARWRLVAAWGTVLTIIAVGLSLSISMGSAGLSIADAWRALFNSSSVAETTSRIVWDLRLPRALCALLAGGGLAISGVLLQAVTRNPLADPGLVGVTAGAGVAATIVLAAFPAVATALPFVAFLGALVSAVVVYAISWQPGVGASPVRMILAGVAVNALLGAVIGILITAFADRIPSVMFWTAGSFNGRSWRHVFLLLPYVAAGLCIAALLCRSLAVMELGDDAARSLGVRVERTRLLAFTAAALLAGSAVAVAGTIGFVGLLIPHLVRLAVGGSLPRVLLLSGVAGAALLLWSDLGARTVLSPSELPVGVITAIIGGPYFVFLLYRSGWMR